MYVFAMADIGDIPPFDDDSCALPLSPSATITSNEDDDLSLNLFPDLIELWDNGQCSVVNHKQDSVIQNSVREIVQLNDEDMEVFNTSQSFAKSQNGGNAMTTSRGFANNGIDSDSVNNDNTAFGQSYDRRRADQLCMTKSAIAARENRMKKKGFVHSLNSSVQFLTSENSNLNRQVSCLQDKVNALQTEVLYLKGVLKNESSLASLLQNIHSTPGVQFVGSDQLGLTQPDSDSDSDCDDTDMHVGRKRHREEESTLKENVPAKKSARHCPTQSRPTMRQMTTLDHDYATQDAPRPVSAKRHFSRRAANAPESQPYPVGGICLHVSDRSVSLELCAVCNKNASAARKTSAYGLRRRGFAGKKSV